ncbi:hypothetical protein [Hymenobacter amundsenii]|uniref:hypothetical protein n=1 Tax=Hymenobacter amundsenii TaxID=2006685 RepID=UPI000F84895C|nr:hypothetical protein [Hymenobacter amundsenii]
MGAPLYDITIYYEGIIIEDAPKSWDFRRKANFIADFYHDQLNGYKPPKTGKICVSFSENEYIRKPHYFGSICSYGINIDANRYLSLTENQRNEYILNLLHTATIDLAVVYGWDASLFEDAYEYIIKSKFIFKKQYPSKKSRDRKHSACIVLEKTETHASLRVLVNGVKKVDRIILEKNNWYWWDSSYAIAKQCKWLNNESFGIDKNGKVCYLSISDKEVISNLVFRSNDY